MLAARSFYTFPSTPRKAPPLHIVPASVRRGNNSGLSPGVFAQQWDFRPYRLATVAAGYTARLNPLGPLDREGSVLALRYWAAGKRGLDSG